MLTKLQKRCADLCFRFKLTHVSSALNTVDLLGEIYQERKDNEPVVLGNSHAALALYVVLEKMFLCNAEEMIVKHGTHASRDVEHGIWVSGGSLGQAETVAVGLALANRNRRVWLVTSDGSCMEGSVYEAMRISGQHCDNLIWNVVANGYGAYGEIPEDVIEHEGINFYRVGQTYPKWLQGLPGHYLTLTKEQHQELMK